MIRPNIFVGFMMLIGTSTAACDRNSSRDVPVDDPLAAKAARPEDQFGKGFGEAFRADPYSQPRNVTENDVIEVSHTAEPVVID